jgi:histidinol-phosphatase (PHP family)
VDAIPIGDYHVHTHFSIDSPSEMQAACAAASARGLAEIAFTDHLNWGPGYPTDHLDPSRYVAEIERCRVAWRGTLAVKLGIEVGEPHHFADRVAPFLEVGPFDVVLGSVHYVGGARPIFTPEYFAAPMRAACSAYFEDVAALAACGDFDVLAHLDVIRRYARQFGKTYDGPAPYADTIRAALSALIERKKALEVNTFPLRTGEREPYPSLEILRWYRDLGGEAFTLGSDAHAVQDVGSAFDAALTMIRGLGFERLATFEGRRMRWTPI